MAVRYASLAMVKDAMGAGNRFRRHIPPLLFLCALTLMIVAIARPAAVVTLPSQHETIILAMDVSGSMRAVDVHPNRLTAAQEAARAFINDQPHNVRIGIVSFAGTAAVVQPPTENREDLLAAIERFTAATRHGGGQRNPRVAEDDFPGGRIRPGALESAHQRERHRTRKDDWPQQAGQGRRQTRTRMARSRCSRARTSPRRSSC